MYYRYLYRESALHSKNPTELTPFSNPNFSIGSNNNMAKFMPVYMSSIAGTEDIREVRSRVPVGCKSEVNQSATGFQSVVGMGKSKIVSSGSIKSNGMKEDARMRTPKSKATVFNSIPLMSDFRQWTKLTN
jgi:hypothetical protein